METSNKCKLLIIYLFTYFTLIFFVLFLFDLELDQQLICVMSRTIGFCYLDKIDSHTACQFWRPLKLMSGSDRSDHGRQTGLSGIQCSVIKKAHLITKLGSLILIQFPVSFIPNHFSVYFLNSLFSLQTSISRQKKFQN